MFKKLLFILSLLLFSLYGNSQTINLGDKATSKIIYAEDSTIIGERYYFGGVWNCYQMVTLDSTNLVDGDSVSCISAVSGYNIIIKNLTAELIYENGSYTSSNGDTIFVKTYNNNNEVVINYGILAGTVTSLYSDVTGIRGTDVSTGTNKPVWVQIPSDISASGEVGYIKLLFEYILK